MIRFQNKELISNELIQIKYFTHAKLLVGTI